MVHDTLLWPGARAGRSPRHSDCQLALPVRPRADDAAEVRRQGVAYATAAELRLQVRRVEQVERLGEQLDLSRAAEPECFADARVDDVDARAADLRLGDWRESILRTPCIHGAQVQVAAAGVAFGDPRYVIGVERIAIEIPSGGRKPRQRRPRRPEQ